MRRIGMLTLALVMALGSLGIAYAAWTDTVTIEGTVNTGSVDLEVVRYSGTWVWKVPEHDIVVWHGWTDLLEENTPADGELIAYAYMQDGEPPVNGDGNSDCVEAIAWNIFPSEDSEWCFNADVLLHYVGSVPAVVEAVEIDAPYAVDPETGEPLDPTTNDLTAIMGWDYDANPIPEPRAIYDAATVGSYDGSTFIGNPNMPSPYGDGRINLYNGWQMHNCDYALLEVILDLPQENDLQGLAAKWKVEIRATQWDEFDWAAADDGVGYTPPTS